MSLSFNIAAGTAQVIEEYRGQIPGKSYSSVIEWAEKHVRLIGSARSEKFDSAHTPWSREPIEMAGGGSCKVVTFIKPVQCGGSAAGEVVLCYWIATGSRGNIQYNWEDDGKAMARWETRVERILKACHPVMLKAPDTTRTTGLWKKGQIVFPHCNFTMQGVYQSANVDSETIRFQVNEEIHNWEPGRLAKAYNRTTAVWDSVIFNISNAARVGSQLHGAWLAGSQQHWEVLCPACGKHHEMRTQWDPKRSDLGGLRYDADGCRLDGGFYDYGKLAQTIRYQMPCGAEIRDDRRVRRAMSRGGRYGKPKNPGAPETEKSYILEAVAVDYISWLNLIQEKHEALRALRSSDPEPWWRYLAERECRFYNPEEDRPVVGAIRVNLKIKKNRDGLSNRAARFAALDFQAGSFAKGELPHWWMVVRDVDPQGNSLLVWEGQCLTDEDAVDVLTQHGVKATCVAVDSGHDAPYVYRFCLKHGFNAIKGDGRANFAHPDGGHRIFSPEKPLHQLCNVGPTRENPAEEPLFWLYSKPGIRERLHWLRGSKDIKWEVPGDASEDYKEHMESEMLQERRHSRTGEVITEWVQVKARNDLFVCECYIAMLMEMAGLIGYDH